MILLYHCFDLLHTMIKARLVNLLKQAQQPLHYQLAVPKHSDAPIQMLSTAPLQILKLSHPTQQAPNLSFIIGVAIPHIHPNPHNFIP